MSIFGPSIPDNLRRHKPEERQIRPPDELRAWVESSAFTPRGDLRVMQVEAVLQAVTEDDYVALWEALWDTVDRERELRGAIRDAVLAVDDEAADPGYVFDTLWNALVRCYDAKQAESGWQFHDPLTAGPPKERVVDVAEPGGS